MLKINIKTQLSLKLLLIQNWKTFHYAHSNTPTWMDWIIKMCLWMSNIYKLFEIHKLKIKLFSQSTFCYILQHWIALIGYLTNETWKARLFVADLVVFWQQVFSKITNSEIFVHCILSKKNIFRHIFLWKKKLFFLTTFSGGITINVCSI